MASRDISLYFLIGCLGFIALFAICCVCSVVCPYARTRAFCLEKCGGYEQAEYERYKKLQQQRLAAMKASELNARQNYPKSQGSYVM